MMPRTTVCGGWTSYAVQPDSEAALVFQEIARRIAVELKPKKIFSPSLRIT
jgi:hypothetical protein